MLDDFPCLLRVDPVWTILTSTSVCIDGFVRESTVRCTQNAYTFLFRLFLYISVVLSYHLLSVEKEVGVWGHCRY